MLATQALMCSSKHVVWTGLLVEATIGVGSLLLNTLGKLLDCLCVDDLAGRGDALRFRELCVQQGIGNSITWCSVW